MDDDDEIQAEIRQTRDRHFAACGDDVFRLMAFYRDHQRQNPDPAHPVVSFVGAAPREINFLSPEEQDAEPWEDDEIVSEIRAVREKLMMEHESGTCVVREEPPGQ